MRWISRDIDFTEAFSKATDCREIDNGRDSEGRVRLLFDSSELGMEPFVLLLQILLQWSGDSVAHYLVLVPDPVTYFQKHFKKYPLLEVSIHDSPKVFASTLGEDPGESPADAVGINWSEYVIVPPSRIWFIHGLRDDATNQGGHLWVPQEWKERVCDAYPWALEG